MEDIGKILEHYLDMWLDERGDIIEERVGIDGYIAVVSFINYIKEHDYESY
jgi:hypothetical protein